MCSVALASQEHRLHNQLALKVAQLLDNLLCGVTTARLVHRLDCRVEGRVEFENIVVYAVQCAYYIGAMKLCGVAQNRNLGFGCKAVAQGYCIVDNPLEIRVYCWLAVARKGDDVGQARCCGHIGKRVRESLSYGLARREALVVVAFGIPATFTVDAVEAANLALQW